MPRLILDLCAGTGAWSEPYRRAGYKVVPITLPHFDVTKVNFDDTHITFLAQTLGHNDIRVPIRAIHGILAAPPCTLFSLARQTRYEVRKNFQEGLEIVESCERIIRLCMAIGYVKWWAMENPMGHLRKFLGRPQMTFEQWQFGDMGIKPTDLWGYFKKPAQTHWHKPTVEELFVAGTSVQCQMPVVPTDFTYLNRNNPNWYTPLVPEEQAHLKGLSRADIRAITPPGFARAFFKANK